ncbi:glucohydrolase [Enemella evansiae]|uniref:Glucohydrolase n=1 Tax=Enemella evansiae TaxID=2016499 RepID=A0A255GF13_9ACTN|nr:alpha-glucosidase [Enemella evansiae]OYO11554.1 glucohydrolase [Enemella evansiae]
MTGSPARNATPWWKQAVGYQVYPRSFADSDGDGIGDLRGVTSRLDHLAELGIDLLWLSPIYPSPMVDNGYDISDYRGIDPTFGTLEDVDELIAEARRRGIRVILDLVVNHTSDAHPWFIESRDPRSPRRDWYWWRPGRGESPPNNWGSRFSGSAWQLDPRSGEYYLHLFAVGQPDLNWENPEVRAEVRAIMNWWLARGISGFRMDVINFIAKPPELPDAPVRPGELWGDAESLYSNGPRLLEFLQELRAGTVGDADDVVLLGETPATTAADAARLTDPANHALDLVFQFEHVQIDHGNHRWDKKPFDLPRLKTSLANWQDGLRDRGWNSLYLNNHDQPRVVTRWGDPTRREESAKLFATMLHAHQGTPFVYQGEEIGMRGAAFTSLTQYQDVQSLNFADEAMTARGWSEAEVLATLRDLSRENARTPMQWACAPAAGFSTGTPWLDVPDHPVAETVAGQRGPDSVLAHYRRLIALRREEPLLSTGRFLLSEPADPNLWIVQRLGAEGGLLAIGNAGDRPRRVPAELHAQWASAQVLLGSHRRERLPVELEPWESLLVKLPGPPAPGWR